ncbi:centrosomal protein 43 isoform X2 [Bombyx mori]|uniref:Uncharacterized protein n=1 Tax=Bombyx mori TaxID=7091 RepID=A0A8R2C7A1_BOMMO|nr:centrosomal protein 43 isoform X1 [Bombyx mori]
MAQSEDTELRDLVIEALEKNGSLAKIRALLRANVFLAFEEDCDIKQNPSLDNIFNLPEESRQEREYKYEGKKSLNGKLYLDKQGLKEPILVSLIKSYHQNKYFEKKRHTKEDKMNRSKLKENHTYLVHDDSQTSTTSNSLSDISSDDRNKLRLRLNLDNSDTDTSSESAKEKSSSEYIPGDHIIEMKKGTNTQSVIQHTNGSLHNNQNHSIPNAPELKSSLYDTLKEFRALPSSSDSTSYAELKPFQTIDDLNKVALQGTQQKYNADIVQPAPSYSIGNLRSESQHIVDSSKSGTISSASSLSSKERHISASKSKDGKPSIDSRISEADTVEYSNDFSTSSPKFNKSPHKESTKRSNDNSHKNISIESQNQGSQSSRSSISISDIADLMSEKSSSNENNSKIDHSTNKSKLSQSVLHSKSNIRQNKSLSDDSGDFTESPIHSLSNLSLDIHSD